MPSNTHGPTEFRRYNEHESENGEREEEEEDEEKEEEEGNGAGASWLVRVSNVESPDRSIAGLRSSFNQIIHAPPMKRGQ